MTDTQDKDKLIKKRSCIKGQLTVYKNYLESIQHLSASELDDQQIAELKMRLSKLDKGLGNFDSLQMEIEILCDNSGEQLIEREAMENQFFTLMSKTQAIIDKANNYLNKRQSLNNTTVNQSSSFENNVANNSVALPTIKLPTFDGCYTKWLEYRDTFTSLIHSNESINTINKFHYLRSSLEGGAAQVIKSFEFCADNYEAAWDLLCERYNNKRLLISNHMKSLFGLEIIMKESDTSLRFIIDHFTKNLSALKNLGQPIEYWDSLIIYLICMKLDNFTSRKWEEHKGSLGDIPTLKEFFEFLRKRADFLETVKYSKSSKTERVSNFASFPPSQASNNNNNRKVCVVCKQMHRLQECPRFISMSLDERNTVVSRNKLCINCLNPGHFANNCRHSPCQTCKYRHNTLLHRSKVQISNIVSDTQSFVSQVDKDQLCAVGASAAEPVSLASATAVPAQLVLLSTALVRVVNNLNNKVHVVRALLDSGSQITLITESLRDKLGLCSAGSKPLTVSGVGNIKLCIADSCRFVMQSVKGNFSTEVNSMVVPRITSMLPSVNVNMQNLNIPKEILVDLADPQFCKPAEIDILIGADLFWEIVTGNQIKLGKGKPTLLQSQFGWLVSGPVGIQEQQNNVISCQVNLDISKQLERFWVIEEIPSTRSIKNSEEDFCEKHFIENTCRLHDGRFCVRMPFHTSPETLGNSLQMAKQRFYNLEKRFSKQPSLKQSYTEFIREYKKLGHLSSSHKIDHAYYLPHHPVLREQSETTKLRVVFDASAKTSTGRSLNDIQGVGPIVQDDLCSILIRFREHSFVFTADIEKMYRQIIINECQRQWQMILWRENENEPLQYFKLNTVTYGTASAPFLSTRCLFQLGEDCGDANIEQIIKHDFYIDDILTGCESESELQRRCKAVVNILASAGFNLRKFRSNSNVLFQDNNSKENQSFSDLKTTTGALGLMWSPVSDNFLFPVHIKVESRLTKRLMLSTIAKIFDPLGLLSIFIVKAKIILQKLWKCKLEWDDEITGDLEILWSKFVKTVNSLPCIDVPRHAFCRNTVAFELHIFSDASQAAYGACIYVRSVDLNGKIHVKLLCAKSRVAPLKSQTIPRLELCGALLSAELSERVRHTLRRQVRRCVHWTDSMVVLGWLNSCNKKLNVFVSNRVNKIKDLTENCEWRYVPTDENPADLVSRGVETFDDRLSTFWWGGPKFLLQNKSQWPVERCNAQVYSDASEVKVSLVNREQKQSLIDFDRYSSLGKLKNVMGYILRFINNCRNPRNKNLYLSLNVDELNNSTIALVKLAQAESFSNELELLKVNKTIPKKSNILSLDPFCDKSGVIRVGGRIENSKFSYDKKHPILLDSKHRLSILIFEYEHKRLMHAGPQLLLASVREGYWIINARNIARSVPHKCIVCKRFKGKTLAPLMGNLPTQRLTPGVPFETTGVDFAGPFYITDRKGRGCKISKCYLCLFVCFTTKALHLEAVSDLSKEAFILTLRRFISRRGKPKYIFCDNGTNFVGAKNELERFVSLNCEPINQFSSEQGIVFQFSPAYAPNFGGLWESGVKSAKFHIKRILGERHLTFEELATLFAQIESILNSRPICPMSSNPNDLTPLTPGHFLIGKPLMSLPSQQLTDFNINRLDRYKQLEQMRQHFWSRWHREYIAELQQRTKWRQRHAELKVGDMVVLKEDNLPPLRWRIGRIQALYPGKDGISRVADVKTGNGILRRAINRLCPLLHPEDTEEEEELKITSTGEDVRA